MTSTISPPSALADELLLGVQEPRIFHVPDYVTSAGQEAVELAALAGLALDPWEQLVLVKALGERADGSWSAFEVGLNVPRQNGKGSILEARELAGLFLFGEKLLIHSAHEQATSSEHFRRLLNLIEGVPQFDQRVLKIHKGKGAQAIELKSGQRIMFKTRTGGGGRGLSGDFVALDEAMILPEATTAALIPTVSAQSMFGNPQIWYSGSAVDQLTHEHGVVFARVRERGIAGSPRVAYFEWSVDGDHPDDVPDEVLRDPEAWAQANPGLGIRISQEHISNECAGALGSRTFAVERLGIGDWPPTDGSARQVIDLATWDALCDTRSSITSDCWFALDVTPDRSWSAIIAAGRRADGLAHVERVEHRLGTSWVVDRLVELVESHDADGVVIDSASPAASLVAKIEDAGVVVKTTSAPEHAKACGAFYDAWRTARSAISGPPSFVPRSRAP